MTQTLVDIRDLSFAYAGQSVLCGINLTIDAGKTLGVIGPNGGGKTTLVKLLLGLLEPAGGSIRIAGMTPKRAVARGDVVGYLPQGQPMPGNFPLSVRQLVRLGLAGKVGFLRSATKSDLDFVDHLIDRVGMADVAEKPVSKLSGGQFQRVLIARALAPRPRLLVLDEPTTGVDARGQQAFTAFITALKTELNLTVAFVSHDLRAVTGISDRVACLNTHLHYHDVPAEMPAEVAYGLFACDLEALGLGASCAAHGKNGTQISQMAQMHSDRKML